MLLFALASALVLREVWRASRQLAEARAHETRAVTPAAFQPTATPIPAATDTPFAATSTPQPETATPLPSITPRPSDTMTPTMVPSPTPSPTATLTPVSAPIVRIVAPAVKLDAPVISVGWIVVESGGERHSEWVVADYAAGHHQNSRLPQQGGNIVISGHHNTAGEVFRYVVDLKEGDEITLYVEDGRSFTYRVTEKRIVLETGASETERQANLQYIGETSDERLTLVTCWPYWTNTHRVIVVAKPAWP